MSAAYVRTAYVRYVGTGVCWTILETEHFYMGSRDELTADELVLCEAGGGNMPASDALLIVAGLMQ